MFKNPITGAILSSSGAIPVKRNPNHGLSGTTSPSQNGSSIPDSGVPSPPAPQTQTNLFRESSIALAAGKVIGVFPEGTSYTQPSIVQIMPGAAWAAVEYAKWVRHGGANEKGKEERREKEKSLSIIPVGIVYTDKAKYLSRVYVRYGKPIRIDEYTQDIFMEGADADAESRAAVKKIMNEVEKQMVEMTINAPDWDTLYASQMARDMLWGGPANVMLKDWVEVNQNLIKVFTSSTTSSSAEKVLLDSVKAALTKYYALLHHTGIEHATLEHLLPLRPSLPSSLFRRILYFLRVLAKVPATSLSSILFVPPLLLHLPAYLMGSLAGKFLAAEGEEETRAQFKGVCGGVGLGVGYGVLLGVMKRVGWLDSARVLIEGQGYTAGEMGRGKRMLGIVGAAYMGLCMGLWVMVKWHRFLVYGNYTRFKTLMAFYKLYTGLYFSNPASPAELGRYTRPPPPPPNPFIRHQQKPETTEPEERKYDRQGRKSISTGRFIRPLLDARAEAFASLEGYLGALKKGVRGEDVEFMEKKGAKIP